MGVDIFENGDVSDHTKSHSEILSVTIAFKIAVENELIIMLLSLVSSAIACFELNISLFHSQNIAIKRRQNVQINDSGILLALSAFLALHFVEILDMFNLLD